MDIHNLIKTIADSPITINELPNDVFNILTKISQWITLIINYGTLLNDETLFLNFNLDNTCFTQEMRLASLGKEYKNWKILPFKLHDSGETWSYEQLVLTSNTGLVEWYCNKLDLTKEDFIKVCNNENVKILGAFYHRMKIILENINLIFDFLAGKKIYGFFDIFCIDKILSTQNLKIKNSKIYELCIIVKEYQSESESEKSELITKYMELEKAIDLSQLALFNFIKDKTFL